MKKVDISNSVAIPVELNNKPTVLSEAVRKTSDELMGKYENLNTTMENADKVISSLQSTAVVITEEDLTGELPSSYGETRIIMHIRDPHWAWCYWEFSEVERKMLEERLGAFEYAHTEMVLRILNDTMGYFFDIKLTDDADNWYVCLNDANCDYRAVLCVSIPSEGIKALATSGTVHTPADRVSDNVAQVVPGRPVYRNETAEYSRDSMISMPCFNSYTPQGSSDELAAEANHSVIESDLSGFPQGSSEEFQSANKQPKVIEMPSYTPQGSSEAIPAKKTVMPDISGYRPLDSMEFVALPKNAPSYKPQGSSEELLVAKNMIMPDFSLYHPLGSSDVFNMPESISSDCFARENKNNR